MPQRRATRRRRVRMRAGRSTNAYVEPIRITPPLAQMAAPIPSANSGVSSAPAARADRPTIASTKRSVAPVSPDRADDAGAGSACASPPTAAPRSPAIRASGDGSATAPPTRNPTPAGSAKDAARSGVRRRENRAHARPMTATATAPMPVHTAGRKLAAPNRSFAYTAQVSSPSSTTPSAAIPSAVAVRPLRRSSDAPPIVRSVIAPTITARRAMPATNQASSRKNTAATPTRETPTMSSNTGTVSRRRRGAGSAAGGCAAGRGDAGATGAERTGSARAASAASPRASDASDSATAPAPTGSGMMGGGGGAACCWAARAACSASAARSARAAWRAATALSRTAVMMLWRVASASAIVWPIASTCPMRGSSSGCPQAGQGDPLITVKQKGHLCGSPSSRAEAGQRPPCGVSVIVSPESTASQPSRHRGSAAPVGTVSARCAVDNVGWRSAGEGPRQGDTPHVLD